jgi:hypothetical protein
MLSVDSCTLDPVPSGTALWKLEVAGSGRKVLGRVKLGRNNAWGWREPSRPASALSETSGDVFARYVPWGTRERGVAASKRSGSGCQSLASRAVHIELRIPRLQAWGVSSTPDESARVDLQDLLHRVYDASGYEHFVYTGSPTPVLAPEDDAWTRRFVPVQR